MARPVRKNLESKYWHVMVQGIGREYIFPDDESKGYYLASIQKGQEKAGVKIIAFCVMGNHAHILLYAESNESLSKFMSKSNSSYAMYYNRTKKRVGYVFRDRFRSEAITEIKYLANCVAHIQNNPVQAGIVESADEYKFSSYTNYLLGSGIVSFEEAAKHFDISPENMRAIMAAKSFNKWMEHDDKEYEDKEKVLQELIQRYGTTSCKSLKKNPQLMVKIVQELQERARVSLREAARMLEISRETLRRAMPTPPSP